jgi:hypothetical protein
VREIRDDTITIVGAGMERVIEDVSAVVLATMRDPVDDLSDALAGHIQYVYVVGDALAPRGLREATYEGHRFGRVIGEQDMPVSVAAALFGPIHGMERAANA